MNLRILLLFGISLIAASACKTSGKGSDAKEVLLTEKYAFFGLTRGGEQGFCMAERAKKYYPSEEYHLDFGKASYWREKSSLIFSAKDGLAKVFTDDFGTILKLSEEESKGLIDQMKASKVSCLDADQYDGKDKIVYLSKDPITKYCGDDDLLYKYQTISLNDKKEASLVTTVSAGLAYYDGWVVNQYFACNLSKKALNACRKWAELALNNPDYCKLDTPYYVEVSGPHAEKSPPFNWKLTKSNDKEVKGWAKSEKWVDMFGRSSEWSRSTGNLDR